MIVYWDDSGPRAAIAVDGELIEWNEVTMMCTDARCGADVVEEYAEMLRNGTIPSICRTVTY